MNEIKGWVVAWEKVFTQQLADRGLLSRMYIINTNQVEKHIWPKGKQAKDMNWEFIKGEIRMGNACVKRYSTLSVVREAQLKQQ